MRRIAHPVHKAQQRSGRETVTVMIHDNYIFSRYRPASINNDIGSIVDAGPRGADDIKTLVRMRLHAPSYFSTGIRGSGLRKMSIPDPRLRALPSSPFRRSTRPRIRRLVSARLAVSVGAGD